MFYLIDVIGSGLLSSIQGPKVKGRFHLFMYVVEPMEERSKNLLFYVLNVWLSGYCAFVCMLYLLMLSGTLCWLLLKKYLSWLPTMCLLSCWLISQFVKFSFVIFTDMKCILINIYSTNIYSLAVLKLLIICCPLSVTTFSILTKYAQNILKRGNWSLLTWRIKPPLNPFHNE